MASKHVEVHCRPSQMAESGCRDSELCMPVLPADLPLEAK
jgi:hypothetical protein